MIPLEFHYIFFKKYGITHVRGYVKTEIDQFRIDLDKKLYQAEVTCWEKNLLGILHQIK